MTVHKGQDPYQLNMHQWDHPAEKPPAKHSHSEKCGLVSCSCSALIGSSCTGLHILDRLVEHVSHETSEGWYVSAKFI